MKTKLLAAVAAAFIVLGTAQAAGAHDVTPDNGSQCTSPTTGEVKFNATNMGNEQRDIFVYLNGTLVGQTLNFTGNGSVKVDITVPQQPAQNITFTWSSDAVMHGSTNIVIDWSKPKCQPEVTTTTTVPEETTTTTIPEETTTTTIPQETTTTTIAVTTTTVPEVTTTLPVCLTCRNVEETTTTLPASTTVPVTVAETVPPVKLAPPVVEVAPPAPVPAKPSLPVTGAMTGTTAAIGAALVLAGLAALIYSKARRAA